MSFGFKPSIVSRQPIYGEQVARKLGYVQHDARGTWFCDATGKPLGRVLRYKPHQAPQPMTGLQASVVISNGLGVGSE